MSFSREPYGLQGAVILNKFSVQRSNSVNSYVLSEIFVFLSKKICHTKTIPTASSETGDLFTEAPLVYGSFWERVGAFFIDVIILLIPNYIVQYALGDGLGNVLSLVMDWLYYAILESGAGQATIGKKALGLKVVTTGGQPISFGQATGRYFGKILFPL